MQLKYIKYVLKQREFMGRFYIKPVITLARQSPPKLKWHKLYYAYQHSGDILASFELVYVDPYRIEVKLTK